MAGFNNVTDFYPQITGQLTVYPGPINQVTATVDNNVGTPHVDVQTEYTADGMNINFDFHDMGIPGTDLTVLQPLTEQQKANARQNINAQEVLTFDSAPTQGSQNPVISGGVYAAEQAIASDVADINAVIPAAATSQNQLADKEYVDDSINRSSAFFRGNFETRAALMAVPWQTTDPDAPNYVSNNDYAYVADDETHEDESWRYIYVLEEGGSNNGWAAQYRVNESPLTTEQLAALNSGITSAGVAQIESNRTGLASHVADTSNPHQVTKAQVGLGNVDNTSDADKPVSTAQQAALDAKQDVIETGSLSNSENAPYLYRRSGGGLTIGNRARLKLVGATMANNQLISNGDFSSGTSGWAKNGTSGWSVSNNVLTHVLGVSTSNNRIYSDPGIAVEIGHKYLLTATIRAVSAATVYGLALTNSASLNSNNISITTSPAQYSVVAEALVNTMYVTIGYRASTETPFSVEISKVMLTDLTLMFGSTIADYVYTLEIQTAGSGVAWLKSYGFFSKYAPYDAGSLISTKAEGKRVVGKNLADQTQFVQGSFDGNGAEAAATNRLRSPFIRVEPSTRYTYKTNSALQVFIVYYYDADKNYLTQVFVANSSYTSGAISADTAYVRFTVRYSDNADILPSALTALQMEKGTTATPYEEYTSQEYDLGSDELRGLFKLDNGNLYADGDVKTADGTITRKYGIVDLGTLTYSYSSTYTTFFVSITGKKAGGDVLAVGYEYKGATANISNLGSAADLTVWSGASDANVFFKNAAYTDAAAFKTAMSGVYLVYELATPTTEQGTPFQDPQKVFADGTEEFVDTRTVPVPVGHETEYLGTTYLASKLGDETVFTEFAPEVPPAPAADGTYVLQVEVSEGTPFYRWISASELAGE